MFSPTSSLSTLLESNSRCSSFFLYFVEGLSAISIVVSVLSSRVSEQSSLSASSLFFFFFFVFLIFTSISLFTFSSDSSSILVFFGLSFCRSVLCCFLFFLFSISFCNLSSLSLISSSWTIYIYKDYKVIIPYANQLISRT